MIKKWPIKILVAIVIIMSLLLISKPNSQGVVEKVSFMVPQNSSVTIHSERDYYVFNAIQISVQEPGNMFTAGNSYTLTYMGILWQTIDLSDQFK